MTTSTRWYSPGLNPILTYTGTLGVGSLYTSDTINLRPYSTIRGVMTVDSVNFVYRFDQSGIDGTWNYGAGDTVDCTDAGLTLNTLAEFGRFRITSVASSEGDVITVHLYGVVS